MSSQAFFWLNVSCGLLLVLLFLFGRKGLPAPSKLNLRRGSKDNENRKGKGQKSPQVYTQSEFSESKNGSSNSTLKNLNVIFMYNGHSFDAFEVLGAPAGASYEMAEKFFNQSLARKSSDSEFLAAALSAIKSNRKK